MGQKLRAVAKYSAGGAQGCLMSGGNSRLACTASRDPTLKTHINKCAAPENTHNANSLRHATLDVHYTRPVREQAVGGTGPEILAVGGSFPDRRLQPLDGLPLRPPGQARPRPRRAGRWGRESLVGISLGGPI